MDTPNYLRVSNTWWPHEYAGHNKEATLEVKELFGGEAPFDTAKPVKLIRRMLELFTKQEGLVVDFFAGSGTTAQAVLELNREDGSNRQFILVQLPEPTGNTQFPTIADICAERVRRVIAKLKAAPGDLTRTTPEDLGFKVFRLAESHLKAWDGSADRTPAGYQRALSLFAADTLRPGWTEAGLLWEVALKEGYGLNSTLAPVPGVEYAWRVADPDKAPAQSFLAVLSKSVPQDVIVRLGLTREDLLVVRDSALDDTLAANLALQCRLKTV